jgi:hypothetical protein
MGTATRQPTSATLPKVVAGFKPSIPFRALSCSAQLSTKARCSSVSGDRGVQRRFSI